MLIYPAIDILGGRCVRLVEGDFNTAKEYSADPVQMASDFAKAGAKQLHVVDLDGARHGSPRSLELIRDMSQAAGIPIQLGGGMRTSAHVDAALEAGAEWVVLGTIMVRSPEAAAALARAWEGRCVAGLDLRGGRAQVSGWEEGTPVDGIELAREALDWGIRRAVVTDVSRDGRLQGANVPLAALMQNLGFEAILSGGVAGKADLAAARAAGLFGAIVGKALYEGNLSIADALAESCMPAAS